MKSSFKDFVLRDSALKAVFFDAGGTLLHPYPSVGHIYARVARRHGVKADPNRLNARFKTSFKKHKKRQPLIDKHWWHAVVREVFTGTEFPNWNRFFNDVYAEFEKKSCWRVEAGGHPLLASLKKRGLRLAVVSNWDARLPSLLKKMGLARYFERQYISCKVGVAKPDVRIFRAALKGMRLQPNEVIHVGDNWEEDILAARKAGIRAVLKR